MIKFFLNYLKNNFFLDKNEKKFIQKFSNIKKQKNYNNNKVIFVNIAMDYAHLAEISFMLQNKKFYDSKIVGIWNYNIHPSWKNSYLKERLISIKNFFINYFFKKKWIKIYKSIGINEVVDTSQRSLFEDYKFKTKSKKLIKKIKKFDKNKFLKLKIKNIIVGDLIVDTYIRFRNIQTIQFNDSFLLEIIKKFMISQSNIEKTIKKFKPRTFLLYYSNYSSGVVARTALEHKVNVFCTGDTMSYLKRLTKNDTNTHTSYRNFKNLFKPIKLKEQKYKKSRIELKKRFTGINDQAYSYMKKNPYKKNSKKLTFKVDGVLFLHDFFDTPHHFKSMIFFDFYEWSLYSLKIIDKYNLNIAIKPHPNSIYQNKIIIEDLKNMFPKIKWIDPEITNKEIFKSKIKFGISVYGSVLYELVYHNLVAIASTPYHPTYNYDIVYTPKNKNEYRDLLINSKKLKSKRNTKQKIEEFYYMWTFYNHDALKETSRVIDLKNINFSSSKSLIQYLKKLKIYENK